MKKISLAKRGRSLSNARGYGAGLLAILLDSGGAQSGKAVLVDGKLPGQEFIDGQGVPAAGLLEREQAAANRSNNFSLTANNPPFGAWRWQIRNC
jgi:predicted RNA methylase